MTAAAVVRERTRLAWKQERADRIAEWFATHRALRQRFLCETARRPIDRITWKRPDNGYYALYYHCTGPQLIVTGDLEDAIYEAGAESLEFWASCDLHYFASKCIASAKGRGFKDWDEEEAQRYVRQILDEESTTAAERQAFEDNDGWDALRSAGEWTAWLGQYGHEVFGGDYWERGGVGEVIDQACEAHLTGLKLAMAQLTAVAA